MAKWATEHVRRVVRASLTYSRFDLPAEQAATLAEEKFDAWLAAHDAEVAAGALYEAARDAQAEKAGGLLRGVVGVTWLRARAAAIRAEAQR